MRRPPLALLILGSIVAAGAFATAYLSLSALADPPDRQARSERLQRELRPLPDPPSKPDDAKALCVETDAAGTGAGLKRLITATASAPDVRIAKASIEQPVVLTGRSSAFDFALDFSGPQLSTSLSLQRLASLRPTIFVHSLKVEPLENKVLVHLQGRIACLALR